MCGGAYLGVGERYPCESVRHARDSTAKFVGVKCTHFRIKSVLNVVGLCAYGGAVVVDIEALAPKRVQCAK